MVVRARCRRHASSVCAAALTSRCAKPRACRVQVDCAGRRRHIRLPSQPRDPHKKVDAPVVHVRLRLAGGFEFGPMPVALTQLERARPLLVGMDVLGELFAAGLHIAR